MKAHLQARRHAGAAAEEEHRPYAGATAPRASCYSTTAHIGINEWIHTIQDDADARPNAEQLALLKHIVQRIQVEISEERAGTKAATTHEPIFDLVHGIPGAGKSKVISWLRELFEQVIGWSHGVQFVCLAFQNSMAAHIDGQTIHHWSGIPAHEADGAAGTRDKHKLSIKCQCLRFILIDEISMVSAELLAALENVVRQVVRLRSTYKKRPNGAERVFGGVNVLFLGDWWQLRPVGGTALFSNPAYAATGATRRGMSFFWGPCQDIIHRTWELTQPMRCVDAWYNSFLTACRDGNLSSEMYNYFHGFPTLTPARGAPSWPFGPAEHSPTACTCSDDVIEHPKHPGMMYKQSWARQFLQGTPGVCLMEGECAECADARRKCRRVVQGGVPEPQLQAEPFVSAPAIYNHNVPTYWAAHLRSREFAKRHNRQLSWCFARDVPLFQDDRELPEKQLHAKRCKWLDRHGQETSHLTSVLPCVVGLPVRLTDSVDRKHQLYRGRRGTIVGWASHPAEERIEVDGEWTLSHLPTAIYIHFPGARWVISEDLGIGVYPVTPTSRTWVVNKSTGVKARRTGYFLLPDFASTAHMIQGQTCQAAECDSMEAHTATTAEHQIAGYVGLSRVKALEGIWFCNPSLRGYSREDPRVVQNCS